MITGSLTLGHLLLVALCFWLCREKGYSWPICLLIAIFGLCGIAIWIFLPDKGLQQTSENSRKP